MAVLTGKRLAELRSGDQADIHVSVDELRTRRGRDGQTFFQLLVSDATGSGTSYVFPDQRAFEPARDLVRGDIVKLRVRVDTTGRQQLEMKALELRVEPNPSSEELEAIHGPLRPEAVEVARGTVGFDIETIPRLDVDELPERERDKFLRAAVQDARRETGAEVPATAAITESTRKLLALHPLTNRVVSIAFHALESGSELALVAAEDADHPPPLLITEEADLLRTFWGVSRRIRTLVGFNSRRFDLPVLLTRSALLGVPAGQDLLEPRWEREARHVDLLDVLQARGAAGDRRVSLELTAFAFGIPVKRRGHGSEVADLYREGRLQELADYNLEDARATAQLYGKLRGTWCD